MHLTFNPVPYYAIFRASGIGPIQAPAAGSAERGNNRLIIEDSSC